MRRADRFDVDDLIQNACQHTGLSDWGDDEFREPLTVLVKALNEEARLTDIGLQRTRMRLDNILIQRLKLVEDRKRSPEIAEQKIRTPLFMTGMPRAGTSLLNSLLAQDPGNIPTLLWQMWSPSPPPNDPSIDHTSQIELGRRLLDFQGHTSAAMRERHYYDALNAEEDGHLCEYSLLCSDFVAYWDVPSYLKYLGGASYVPAYAWHKRVLQALQVGAEGRRWTLKSPGHILHLPPLLEVYPDAKFVLNHRDPSKVLASVMSLIGLHQEFFGNKPLVLNREFALSFMEQMALSWDFIIQLRQDPAMDKRFVDVMYLDLERHPLVEVERVYAHWGVPLSDTARNAMEQFFSRNRKGQFGSHTYRLADYSIHADEVRERFQNYLRHFNVPAEEAM